MYYINNNNNIISVSKSYMCMVNVVVLDQGICRSCIEISLYLTFDLPQSTYSQYSLELFII